MVVSPSDESPTKPKQRNRGVWANWKADEKANELAGKAKDMNFHERLFNCLVCWKLNKWRIVKESIRILDVEQYEVDKGKMVLQKL